MYKYILYYTLCIIIYFNLIFKKTIKYLYVFLVIKPWVLSLQGECSNMGLCQTVSPLFMVPFVSSEVPDQNISKSEKERSLMVVGS